MSIRLERIDFNHNDQSANTDGLNIRADYTAATGPWLAGGGASAVAYALAETFTSKHSITIKATFSFSNLVNPPGPAVMVRARPLGGTSSVLGKIEAIGVPFPTAGAAPTMDIEPSLTGVKIWTEGIGRYNVSWIWEAQWSSGGAWTFIAQSDHIVYVTLRMPGAPWSQATDATHARLWPWTRALDVACVWAKGVTITKQADVSGAAGAAAKRIEQHVYDLAERASLPLTYNESPVYALNGTGGVIVLLFSDFLTLIEGSLPQGKLPHLNCTDCASALATLANALGCGLALRRVQRHDGDLLFHTNPIVPLGRDPAHPVHKGFGHHDVTVRAAGAGASGRVHDACLMIDRDSNPASSASANYQLAKGLTLGSFKSVTPLRYVQRLVESHLKECKTVDPGMPSLEEALGTESSPAPVIALWDLLRKQVDRLAPPIEISKPPVVNLNAIQVKGFYPYEQMLSPPQLKVLKGLVTASAQFSYVAVPPVSGRKRRQRDERLQISIGYAPTARQARDALAWTLTQTATPPPPVPATENNIGDAAFGGSRHQSLYLVRGGVLVQIVSSGRDPVPLLPIARVVDTELQRRTHDSLRSGH